MTRLSTSVSRLGRDVTLGDIFAKPMAKALERLRTSAGTVRSLSVPSRCLFVNVFYYLPLRLPLLLFYAAQRIPSCRQKNRYASSLFPSMVGPTPMISWFCVDLLFGIKPALKDLWAFNVSLLAARSSLITASINYNSLPDINIVFSRMIIKHRNCAAVDFWSATSQTGLSSLFQQ